MDFVLSVFTFQNTLSTPFSQLPVTTYFTINLETRLFYIILNLQFIVNTQLSGQVLAVTVMNKICLRPEDVQICPYLSHSGIKYDSRYFSQLKLIILGPIIIFNFCLQYQVLSDIYPPASEASRGVY